MDRLTEKIEDNYIARQARVNGKTIGNQRCLNKLGELEDLAEQGRLFILPCKKGDTVYTPCAWGVESDVVGSVEYVNDKIYIKNYYGGIVGEASSVFLTEDEATRKAKELLGEDFETQVFC